MWPKIKVGLDVLGTLVIIVAGSVVIWRVLQPPSPPGSRPLSEDVEGVSLSSAAITHSRGDGPIVLVEFADYECPYCARHAQQTAPAIKEQLVDRGRVRQVFFNLPLPNHPRAQKAAEAAECAAKQGRFWDMHERLFASPGLEVGDLIARAEQLELDKASFAACLESGETTARVREHEALAQRFGVRSTPSFFIGTMQGDGSIKLTKRINGAVPYETFEQVVSAVEPSRGRRIRVVLWRYWPGCPASGQ